MYIFSVFFSFPEGEKIIPINFSMSVIVWYIGLTHFDYSFDLLTLDMIEKLGDSVKANLSSEMLQDNSLKGTDWKNFYR